MPSTCAWSPVTSGTTNPTSWTATNLGFSGNLSNWTIGGAQASIYPGQSVDGDIAQFNSGTGDCILSGSLHNLNQLVLNNYGCILTLNQAITLAFAGGLGSYFSMVGSGQISLRYGSVSTPCLVLQDGMTAVQGGISTWAGGVIAGSGYGPFVISATRQNSELDIKNAPTLTANMIVEANSGYTGLLEFTNSMTGNLTLGSTIPNTITVNTDGQIDFLCQPTVDNGAGGITNSFVGNTTPGLVNNGGTINFGTSTNKTRLKQVKVDPPVVNKNGGTINVYAYSIAHLTGEDVNGNALKQTDSTSVTTIFSDTTIAANNTGQVITTNEIDINGGVLNVQSLVSGGTQTAITATFLNMDTGTTLHVVATTGRNGQGATQGIVNTNMGATGKISFNGFSTYKVDGNGTNSVANNLISNNNITVSATATCTPYMTDGVAPTVGAPKSAILQTTGGSVTVGSFANSVTDNMGHDWAESQNTPKTILYIQP